MRNNENIYTYKESVSIPTLALIDDLFKISTCGAESVKSNAAIGAKVEIKNLRFEIDVKKNEAPKCKHIHVGKRLSYCPNLKAHNVPMKKVSEAKYLRDIISATGKMTKTIAEREKRTMGITSQILMILKEVSLEKFYFQIAILLRNLLFINSVLVNSEVWFPLKERELKELESTDRLLLRRILDAPPQPQLSCYILSWVASQSPT